MEPPPLRDDGLMITSTSPYTVWFAMLLATFIMVATGMAKKRLVNRGEICPVCHRERRQCTCRWL